MTASKGRILVVDDEAGIRLGVRRFLESKGFEVEAAEGCAAAEALYVARPPDAVLLDYRLGDGNGVDLLTRLKKVQADVPMVMLTAYGSIELAVDAVKAGAEQFLTKPLDMPALQAVLERLLETERERRRRAAGRTQAAREALDPFRGTSSAIRALADEARSVLPSDSAVLIQGPTGTGKGVLARWLHENGPRGEEVFVDLNCAAMPRDLLESELFGYEAGAFTGAARSKMGLFEVAHKGTVFLDEVGDMDVVVQPRLLKAIEEKKIRRLGDVRDRRVDIRLVSASHHDLAARSAEKQFRSDLLFRLNTVTLVMPSLVERREDVPLLATDVLLRLASEQGRSARLSEDASRALQEYHWPGNIRELRNVLERALLLTSGPVVEKSHLRFTFTAPAAPPPTAAAAMEASAAALASSSALPLPTLEALEKEHIRRVLEAEGGHVERAARVLGVSKSSLYLKVRKLGLVPAKRSPAP